VTEIDATQLWRHFEATRQRAADVILRQIELAQSQHRTDVKLDQTLYVYTYICVLDAKHNNNKYNDNKQTYAADQSERCERVGLPLLQSLHFGRIAHTQIPVYHLEMFALSIVVVVVVVVVINIE
jgi:hypothetical protein